MRRLKTTLSFCTTLLLAFSSFFTIAAPVRAESNAQVSKVVITEIKLGGPAASPSQPKEFVSIYNQTDADIDLNNWHLEYAKDSFGPTHCAEPYWTDYDNTTQTSLSGNLPARSLTSFEISLTDNIDGSLRIVQETDDSVIQHDLVGWGNDAPCFESGPATKPSTTSNSAASLQRYLDCEQIAPTDSDNNANDFEVSHESSYGKLGGNPSPDCPGQNNSNCEGVIISEVLPNPAGVDQGGEFIELHNTESSYRSLAGCGLQVSSGDIYWFKDLVGLEPNSYKAFYNDETNLTLPNASGGTVYLLSADEEELAQVNYAPNLDDDVSWSWFGGSVWHPTYQPTPNASNKLQSDKPCPAGQTRSSSSGRCIGAVAGSDLKPCDPGQTRNPATNRCRSILAASASLKPCRADQTRNPATNRCRSLLSASSTLVPCKAGQSRNPATNRCKKMDSASTSLKPCQPGQERNPATNRCRKASNFTQTNSSNPLEVTGAIPTSPLSTGLVATTAGLALVYGAYEFRHGIRNRFELIRRHFSARWHSGP